MYCIPRGSSFIKPYMYQRFFGRYMILDKLTYGLSSFEYKQYKRFIVKTNL